MKCPYCEQTMVLESASMYLDYDEKGKQSRTKYMLNINYKCDSCSFFGSLRKGGLDGKDAATKIKEEDFPL
jgi:hypothetical protein